MMDINLEVEKILSELSVRSVYSTPLECGELPCVSYYMLTDKGSFYADNEEEIRDVSIQVDIWAREGYQCGTIAMDVNALMRTAGYYRELSMDIPKGDDGVYHRTMRFIKSCAAEYSQDEHTAAKA